LERTFQRGSSISIC